MVLGVNGKPGENVSTLAEFPDLFEEEHATNQNLNIVVNLAILVKQMKQENVTWRNALVNILRLSSIKNMSVELHETYIRLVCLKYYGTPG